MLNRVFLIGNLTADPNLRYTPSGVSVATFTVAVNRIYTTQSGERKKETDFFDVVVWKKQAVNVANYLKKGSKVFVEGRLSVRSYENKEGQRITKTEITALSVQFLDRAGAAPGGTPEPVGLPTDDTETYLPDDFGSEKSTDEFYG